MYELKTNTATRIAVGPLVDPTDGKTAEIDPLTVTALSVQIYQLKTDGTAVVRAEFSPTASGGDNDMVLVASSTDGVYDLELTAAQLNFYGNARLSLYDVDGFLVHYIDLQIVSANYFNNKYGTTVESVNLSTIKTQTVTCGAGVTINPSVGAATIVPTNTQFEARTLASAGYADAVWDEIIAGHAGVGSTGAALSAAGGSGDPWSTALPGAYGVGTAGSLIGTTIPAIEADTDDLQTNQGNWLTATGFALAGGEMKLEDDAITASKYDQTTAWPLATEDSSATASSALDGITDNTDMYNLALGLIGEYEVASGDVTSKQYKLCNRFYAQSLKKALCKHPWNEAIETVTLMQSTTAPLTEFSYQYAKPSDCLQVRSIGNDEYHWEVQGQNIVTDYSRVPDVWLTATAYVAGQYVQVSDVTYLCATSHTSTTWAADTAYWTTQVGDYNVIDVTYIKTLTDVTLMSVNLIDAIAHELAIMVVVGITGDVSAKKDLLEQFNKDIIPNARSIDGVEGRLKRPYQSKWIRARS